MIRRLISTGWLLVVLSATSGTARAQVSTAQQPPAVARRVFDITAYGAKRDASEPATEAFAKAIAAAKAAGGGTVFVPAGRYISGPIELISHLRLEFDAGAIITFPAQILPLTPGRQQGIETLTPVPLIGGHDLEDVQVIGPGTLITSQADWIKLHGRKQATATDLGSANGDNWEKLLLDLEAHKPISETEYTAAAQELRPSFLRFMNSKDILVDGLHFEGAAMWTIHLLYTQYAVVRNVVIETYPGVQTDGIVVDSSRFVHLTDDYIDTGDNSIVIKAARTPTASASTVLPKMSPSPAAPCITLTARSPSAQRPPAACATLSPATSPQSTPKLAFASRAGAGAAARSAIFASLTGPCATSAPPSTLPTSI